MIVNRILLGWSARSITIEFAHWIVLPKLDCEPLMAFDPVIRTTYILTCEFVPVYFESLDRIRRKPTGLWAFGRD